MAGTPADIRGVVVEKATSLGAWADVIRDRFVPLQIAPHDASELAGSVQSRLVGHLQAAVVVSTPQAFTRTRRLVSASGAELWALGLVEAAPDTWSRTAGPALLPEETSCCMTPHGLSPGPWRGTGSCGCTPGR